LRNTVAIMGSVLVLLGCSSSTHANERSNSLPLSYSSSYSTGPIGDLLGVSDDITMLEKLAEDYQIASQKEFERKKAAIQNRMALESRMKALYSYVGKTPYVFAGSTPRGWDCSGLVLWFYSGLGVDLEHSATKQAMSGKKVEIPAFGDLVAFKHFSAKKYFHIGIYIGDGKIIHSREPGTVTAISEINDKWFERSYVEFVRIVDTQ